MVSLQGWTFGDAELNLIDGSLPRELNASRKAKREAVPKGMGTLPRTKKPSTGLFFAALGGRAVLVPAGAL